MVVVFDDDAIAGFGIAEVGCGGVGGSPLGDDVVLNAHAVAGAVHIAAGAMPVSNFLSAFRPVDFAGRVDVSSHIVAS